MRIIRNWIIAIAVLGLSASSVWSQISYENYKRADDLIKKTTDKVYYGNVRPVWIGKTNNFLYESLTPGGTEYIIVNAEKLTKRKAFNQEKFASAFEVATGKKIEPGKLPIKSIVFSDKLGSFAFTYDNYNWICNLKDYKIIKREKIPSSDRPNGWDLGFQG